jgi:hemimethylated DNA binding protein
MPNGRQSVQESPTITPRTSVAKFMIGQIVRHRMLPLRGVVFDIDPEFANTEEWYESIPMEARPRKDQPFYHLLAENTDTQYIVYVSEQNSCRTCPAIRWRIRKSTISSSATKTASTDGATPWCTEPTLRNGRMITRTSS